MAAPLIAAALPLLAEFAPSLIRTLAGEKAGDVADNVIGVAKAITGKASPEDALVALRENPELQHQFRMKLAEMEVQIEEAYLADRQNARGLTASLAAAGHDAAWSAPLISLVVIVGFFAMLYVVLDGGVAQDSADVAFMMLGSLAQGFGLVLAFWLGSSKGSKDKDSILAAIQKRIGQ